LVSIFVPETVPTPITRPFSSLLTTALLGAKRCPENAPAFLLSLSFDHHFANIVEPIVEPVFAPNINASLHLLPEKNMATTTPVSLMKVMPYKGVGCFQWIILREEGRKQCM